MKVAVSYFAQLRNFKPNMVPISTALYDPKWFHDYKGVNNKFLDKNGVLNGVRCKDLAPGRTCSTLCCGASNCNNSPKSCEFLKKYKEQLDSIDKERFRAYCNAVAAQCARLLNISTNDITLVFMVYEKYDNPCSERNALLQFLGSCGYDAKELSYPIG